MYRSQYQVSYHPSSRAFDHNGGKEISPRGVVRRDYPGSGASEPETLLEREAVN